jgi:hypothetical protein
MLAAANQHATVQNAVFHVSGCDVTQQCKKRPRDVFSAWSIGGFIGETEVCLQFLMGDSGGRFVVEDLNM